MKPYASPKPGVVYLNDLFRVSIERDELPGDPRFIHDLSARVYDCRPPHMWSMRADGFDAAGAVEDIDPCDNLARNKALISAWYEWVEAVDGPDAESRQVIVCNRRYLIAGDDCDAVEAYLGNLVCGDYYAFYLEVLEGGEWHAVDYTGDIYACEVDDDETLEDMARSWGRLALQTYDGVAAWGATPNGISLEYVEADVDGGACVRAIDLEPAGDGVKVFVRCGGARAIKAAGLDLFDARRRAQFSAASRGHDVHRPSFYSAAAEWGRMHGIGAETVSTLVCRYLLDHGAEPEHPEDVARNLRAGRVAAYIDDLEAAPCYDVWSRVALQRIVKEYAR